MLAGDFADRRRDQVDALGDHDRRAHALLVVLQRDGEVRRVRDDHVGLRHFLHHALARHLLLHLADAALHFGRAFAFLVFLADFLAAHAHLLGVLPQLIRHVEARDDQQAGGDREQRLAAQLHGVSDRLLQRLATQRQQRRRVVPQHDHRDDRDDAELRQRLGQLDEAAHREHALDAFERIQPVELRRHRLPC